MPITSSKFNDFVDALNKGSVCVFNTDTVVGIGCLVYLNKGDATDTTPVDNSNAKGYEHHNMPNDLSRPINLSGIKKIFEIKQRSFSKKLPWLVDGVKMMECLSNTSSEGYINALDLASSNWPGDTTIIVKVKDDIAEEVCGPLHSLAFRNPNVDYINKAISTLCSPIACTSANIAGKSPVKSIKELDEELLKNIDFVFDCCPSNLVTGVASSIYDCTSNSIKKLR